MCYEVNTSVKKSPLLQMIQFHRSESTSNNTANCHSFNMTSCHLGNQIRGIWWMAEETTENL